ncbi:MAG: hypothetical protein JWM27_566 [Gemmatimonadetes bacterium]|nr:hypothetical protein [Gemmatimonadota bacterium]
MKAPAVLVFLAVPVVLAVSGMAVARSGPSAQAVSRAAHEECDPVNGTHDVELCLEEKLNRQEGELRAVQDRIVRLELAKPAKLRPTDAAWRRYRDLECRGVYDSYTGGTGGGGGMLGCQVQLTEARIQAMKDGYELESAAP